MKRLASILILFIAVGLMAMSPVKDTGKQSWAATAAYPSCAHVLVPYDDNGDGMNDGMRVALFCCEFTASGQNCWIQ